MGTHVLWLWVIFLLPCKAEAICSPGAVASAAEIQDIASDAGADADIDAANLDVSDLVRVTCTPVIREGEIRCECYPPPPEPHGYFFASPDEGARVTCPVELVVLGPRLRSTCSPLADNQRFVECRAVLPRSLVVLVSSIPSTTSFQYFTRRHPKFKSQVLHSCTGDCLKRDQTNTCVPDPECRRCVQDFKLFFPENAGSISSGLCQDALQH